MGLVEAVLIDWGTTNARAFAVDGQGNVLNRNASGSGILNVENAGFAAAFDELTGRLRASGDIPVLMSGMIGSRQGWVEASYVACPASASALVGGLVAVPEQENVRIVSGVCKSDNSRRADVMRGEEVQCFGALALENATSAVICLPGTHSKWVRIEASRIVDFATSMTGEAFAVMRRHSILAALMPGDDGAVDQSDQSDASQWFIAGIARSGEPGGLLHHLFSVRADGLFGYVPSGGLADYLSGILIGHEIRAMSQLFEIDQPILLIASDQLSGNYLSAFAHLGLSARALDPEQATVAGLVQVLAATKTG